MKKKLGWVLLWVIVSSMWTTAAPVSLTSLDGKTIQVNLKSSTDTEVTFQILSNKRVYTLSLDKLDVASKGKIKKWKAAGGGASDSYKISFSSGKSNRSSPDDHYDDRQLELTPIVTIVNSDRNAPTKASKITILVLGRPVEERNAIFVFAKEDKLLAPIEALGEKIIELDVISSEYDDRGSSQYGSRYLGYAVLVYDEDSKIIASKSVPTPLVGKHGAMLLGLKRKSAYDKLLKPLRGYRR